MWQCIAIFNFFGCGKWEEKSFFYSVALFFFCVLLERNIANLTPPNYVTSYAGRGENGHFFDSEVLGYPPLVAPLVKRTEPWFWSHAGQKHHMVERRQKDRFVIFGRGAPKISKKSWRETFGTIGVKVRRVYRSKFRKFGPYSHHKRTEPEFWSHTDQKHHLIARR